MKHKPMYEDNSLQLNLKDEYGIYGICLTSNTRKPFYFDMEDYNLIKDYCWCEVVDTRGYHYLRARNLGKSNHIRFTSLIGCKYYDHIDRNPFNNRKYNLRPATVQENNRNKSKSTANTSGFIGVSFDKKNKRWQSFIRINGKAKCLGSFKNKEDAIKTRLQAEHEYFGEFAPQKELFEEYGIVI